jgi:hypothetical protein
MGLMSFQSQYSRWMQSPAVRLALFIFGCVLMALAPLAGLLPGPGGIFLFAFGLGFALRSSIWAKRHYVRLKKQQPKIGGWADWGLRRKSALRRQKREKRAKSD